MTTSSMEAMALTISGQKTIRVVLLYRLIPSISIPRTAFLADLHDVIENLAVGAKPFVILGDFNIRWNVISDGEQNTLSEICSNLELLQHVHFPTHENGNTLDLLISRSDANLIANIEQGPKISDHVAVHFSLNIAKPHAPRCKITFRKLGNIDHEALGNDLRHAFITAGRYDDTQPEPMLEHYETTLKDLLDRHAPRCEKVVALKPRAPWCTEEIAIAKQERR